MKITTRYIIALAIIAILAITTYQGYWLVNIYNSLDATLQKELNEVLRASDFEEIVHRVERMRADNFGGSMQVTSKVDNEYNQTELTTTRKESLKEETAQDDGNNHNLAPADFTEALREESDVMNIGLNMQRGIHSGLDELQGPDLDDLYAIIGRRMDSLNIHVDYALLYGAADGYTHRQLGAGISNPIIYRIGLDLNTDTEYQLLIPRYNFIVLRKMNASLMFSGLTLLMLIGTFVYTIRLIRRMRTLDEMKSDFVNNITHELKTPIAVAYAANDALLNFGTGDPATMRQYLTISLQQLNQLSGLVEQILSLSMERRNTMQLQMSDVDVNELLDSLVETHQLKSGNKVQFTLQAASGLNISTDRVHFHNILSNLIDNAIKYSQGDPHVTIRARHTENGRLRIEVEDQGIGIKRECLPYIFEKFYRVPNGNIQNVKGYGLGLFYVKSLVDKMGGTIEVKSEEGHGSTFILTL